MSIYREASKLCIILFIVTVTDRIKSVDGLKCYKCDSRLFDHRNVCTEDFKLTSSNRSFIIDNCEYCNKYLFSNHGGIVRNCTLKTKGFSFKFGCENKDIAVGSVEICSCNENLCNGAISRLTVLPVYLLIYLFIFIFHD